FQTNEFFVINEKQLVCFAPNQLVYLILEQIKEGKYQLFSYIELYKNDKLIGDGARLLPVGRG
ncbi:MAG TPA: hypothetical protein DDY49_09750, partial [Paenibacillaceae bacterium]|nr:hypothetical protein [Paenibacillaceae bacterium]